MRARTHICTARAVIFLLYSIPSIFEYFEWCESSTPPFYIISFDVSCFFFFYIHEIYQNFFQFELNVRKKNKGGNTAFQICAHLSIGATSPSWKINIRTTPVPIKSHDSTALHTSLLCSLGVFIFSSPSPRARINFANFFNRSIDSLQSARYDVFDFVKNLRYDIKW